MLKKLYLMMVRRYNLNMKMVELEVHKVLRAIKEILVRKAKGD